MRIKRLLLVSIITILATGLAGAWAQTKDANQTYVFPFAAEGQPSYDKLRSPIKARVIDRRFVTSDAMYLANEMNIGGDPFLQKAMLAGLPVGEDKEFQYMTAVESYWYSRYNMSALVTESRLGIHMVHGPYVAEKAIRQGTAADNRVRGEDVETNKSELIRMLVPSYLVRSGFPRRFEDASPLMLQFASGDPFYPMEVDKGKYFESTENLQREKALKRLYGDRYIPQPRGMDEGGNDLWRYRINYRENFLTLRWDHSKMDHTIDLGAEGQTLMKQILWAEYFFRDAHHNGRFIGNNPEEGFRGAMLVAMAVSKMLALKSMLLTDGSRLFGINPATYDPAKKLAYFPHEVNVRLRYMGDLPPRPEEFKIKDSSSRLFDQASLLWGLSEYYYFSDPMVPDRPLGWARVFGNDTPYDGSIMEQKYTGLAQALANVVLRNISAMHVRDGILVSSWDPRNKAGKQISTTDLGLTLIALANYSRALHVEPENQKLARDLLRSQSDFLVARLQNADGSFPDGFDAVTGTKLGSAPTLEAQGFAIRGLLKASEELNDVRYADSARRAYKFMNASLWDTECGVYRSSVDAERTVYTPLNLGAALGAMREIILLDKDANEVERFKRFWVQGVNSSGIQQAEYEETGEMDFSKQDGDGDGIPRMEFAGGKHGIAPVYAARVKIETPLRAVAHKEDLLTAAPDHLNSTGPSPWIRTNPERD